MARHSKKGLQTRSRIAFLDESGISERPTVRRTWAPRGQTPVIAGSGSWKVRSVIGAIVCDPGSLRPKFYLAIISGIVRKAGVAKFLSQLRRHEHGRLILLWDNLSSHRGTWVKDWAGKNRTTVAFLPAYAPELNPVEYAWATAKNCDLANLYPEGLPKLDEHIRHMRRRLQRRTDILQGFLKKSSLFG